MIGAQPILTYTVLYSYLIFKVTFDLELLWRSLFPGKYADIRSML